MKIFTRSVSILFFTLIASLSVVAQSESVNKSSRNIANAMTVSHTAKKSVILPSVQQYRFDLQFADDESSLGNGLAGAVWFNNGFWVSKWASDSLYSLDATGAMVSGFKITGVGAATSGVRGMTYGNGHVYAGDNTTAIKVINPVTKTLLSTITAPISVRGIAYDSTADGGLGGLWVSNFNTDIDLISLSGALLNTIPAASHGLTGMYGIAFDNYTAGGPYIWAYNQGGTNTNDLDRIEIASGTLTAVTFNTFPTVGVPNGVSATNALAGGVFITDGIVPGKFTIGGMMQGSKDMLFGLELSDSVLNITNDALNDSLVFYPPFTITPSFLLSPVTFNGYVQNAGINSLATVSMGVTAIDGSNTTVYTGTSNTVTNLASGSGTALSVTPTFTLPGIGSYLVTSIVNTGAQIDVNNANDTLSFVLSEDDSVMAREDGLATGSLGIGDGTGGTLGQIFTFPASALITSITVSLNAPTEGDSTSLVIYDVVGGVPSTQIATTGTYVFTAADAASGVVLTLPLTTPYLATAGNYLGGINEFSSNVTIGTTPFNFRTNSSFVTFTGTPWTAIENVGTGFLETYLIRLNTQNATGINEIKNEQSISLFPNPANDRVAIVAKSFTGNVIVQLTDISGKMLLTKTDNASRLWLDTSSLEAGVYFVKITSENGKTNTSKLVISK